MHELLLVCSPKVHVQIHHELPKLLAWRPAIADAGMFRMYARIQVVQRGKGRHQAHTHSLSHTLTHTHTTRLLCFVLILTKFLLEVKEHTKYSQRSVSKPQPRSRQNAEDAAAEGGRVSPVHNSASTHIQLPHEQE